MSQFTPVLRWVKTRFPRLSWALRWARPSRIEERFRYRGLNTQQIFEKIVRDNSWAVPESLSGAGSTLATTAHLRAELPRVLDRLQARSIFDAPCGDFHWMQHCDLRIPYIGADIVPSIVASLRDKYTRTTPPTRTFLHLDITSDPFPDADLFFCRDCFLHLSFRHINQVLDNFLRSRCRYMIASTYRDVRANIDNFTGGVRIFHLCLPPFGFPDPLEYIEDRGEGQFQRCMGVWTREQVAGAKDPKAGITVKVAPHRTYPLASDRRSETPS